MVIFKRILLPKGSLKTPVAQASVPGSKTLVPGEASHGARVCPGSAGLGAGIARVVAFSGVK